MRFDIGILCCPAAILCAALALAGSLPAAAAALATCAACFVAASKARGAGQRATESDALRFIDNIIGNYSDSASTVALLEKSLNGSFAFCREFRDAIRTYSLSADAGQAFSALLRSDSYALRGIASATIGRLDGGAELRMRLVELRRHVMRRNGNALKNTGLLGSALSVTQIGAALFFPAFAGISLRIMQFTEGMQNAGHPSAQALVAVFAFYIAYLNLLNFKYNMREDWTVRAEKSALSCAAALLVFKAASTLSML
jgi:hypothetical protein